MQNEEIRVKTQELLRGLYPDALVAGSRVGVSGVDFFLEQCIVTKRHDEESIQRRVIAIIAADWATFAQNYDYRVSAGWFRWHDMMDQAKAVLKSKNCLEAQIEDKAKKLVKNSLINQYGKEVYDAAQNTGAFLVKHADWDQLDAMAKRICEALHIEPHQLSIVMVAGSQNTQPLPQVQGLCRHGHELRFCIVDDVLSSIARFFYHKPINDSFTILTLNEMKAGPKKNLREILNEKPTVVGYERSLPEGPKDSQILKLQKMKELKVLSWNVGLGNRDPNADWWSWWKDEVLKIIKINRKNPEYQVIFLQEVPNAGANINCFNLENIFYKGKGFTKYLPLEHYDVGITSKGSVFFVTLTKRSEDICVAHTPVSLEGYLPFALITTTQDFIAVNVHLKSNIGDQDNERIRLDQMKKLVQVLNKIRPFGCPLILGGDFNGYDPRSLLEANWSPVDDNTYIYNNCGSKYDWIGCSDLLIELIVSDAIPNNQERYGYHKPVVATIHSNE